MLLWLEEGSHQPAGPGESNAHFNCSVNQSLPFWFKSVDTNALFSSSPRNSKDAFLVFVLSDITL